MPAKKARKGEEEGHKEKDESKEEIKEETKVKAKRGKKAAEPPVEEVRVIETTTAEIEDCIRTHVGSPDCHKKLKDLLHNSTVPRGLINSAVALIFNLVEATPTLLNWGKKCIENISSDLMEPKKRMREAFFFPSEASERRLVNHLASAKTSMLICVFALTNDTLANAIRAARERGVDVKLIFDDEMMKMPGSDVKKLHDEGFPVRVDLDPKAHMHHKFVVIDDTVVITGSYNWTRQASNKNHENIVVFEDTEIAQKYIEEFNKLWEAFSGSIEKSLGGPAQKKE